VNRREVLTGIAFGSAAVAVPAAAMAKTLPAGRTAWDRAMADLERAKAASDAYEVEYWRIEAAYKADVDKVPHFTVEIDGRSISTADSRQVAWARHDARNIRYVEACAYNSVRQRQQLADAADARDARIAAINQHHRWDAVNEHYDGLSVAICDAEEVLLNMPAPDGEALLWKVNRLYAPGAGIWEPSYEAQTHADLRRILSHGRA
jgi:hypothetical protein